VVGAKFYFPETNFELAVNVVEFPVTNFELQTSVLNFLATTFELVVCRPGLPPTNLKSACAEFELLRTNFAIGAATFACVVTIT
jgi:hypothetical protein